MGRHLTRWDPRADQIRMLKAAGLSISRVADQLNLSITRVADLTSKYLKEEKRRLPPPTIEERMERCTTPGQELVTANLFILRQRVMGKPIPKWLLKWETGRLSGLGPRLAVLEAMRLDDVHPEGLLNEDLVDFYVIKEVAPALLDTQFDQPAWTVASDDLPDDDDEEPDEENA